MMAAEVPESVFSSALETLRQKIVNGTLSLAMKEGVFVTAVISTYLARGKQAVASFAPSDAGGTPLGDCVEALRESARRPSLPGFRALCS